MQEKKKSKWKNKKLLIIGLCSLLVIAGMSIYSIRRYVYADTYTWEGSFPYSTDAWKYSTVGQRYCTYSWNGNTVTVYDEQPGGFDVEPKNGTYYCSVDEDEASAYLVPLWKSKGLKVGDVVTWQSDTGVTFSYNDGNVYFSASAGTVSEALALNNTDWSYIKESILRSIPDADFSNWYNRGPFYFGIKDDSGLHFYCSSFVTDWKVIKFGPRQFTISGLTLNTKVEPKNSGTVTGGGQYLPGEKATVTAKAKPGYTFEGWYVDGKKVTSNTSYTVNLPNEFNVTYTAIAKFVKNDPQKYILSVSHTEGGSVSGDSGEIEEGKSVTVVAKPLDGYSFIGWYEGDTLKSTNTSYSFTMPGKDVNLDAKFEKGVVSPPPPPPVTEAPEPDEPDEPEIETYYVSVNGSGNGSVSGGGSYAVGDTVYLSASAFYGSYFQNWYSSDCSLSSIWSTSASFTMPDHDVTIYGYFYDYGPNTVAYFPNGGEGTSFTEYTDSFDDYDHYVSEPKTSWTPPSGYNAFLHWGTTKKGGTLYNPGDYISYTGTYFTLYAQWNPNTYIVQFASDDLIAQPTPTLGPQQIWTYDSPTPMPEKPFDKQFTVSYDLNKKESMSTTPNLTEVLTSSNTDAVFNTFGWRPHKYEDGIYVVIGELVAPGEKKNLTSVQDDRIIMFPEWGGKDSYIILPIVQCDGYDFRGWLKEKDKDSTDITKAMVAEPAGQKYQPIDDCTLYGMYTPKIYQVGLDYQNPDLNYIKTIIMTFDAYGPDVEVPERLHYTFKGYYTGQNGTGTQYYDANGKSVKKWQTYDGSITTLYAYWVLDTQIVYHRNQGLGYMQDSWLTGNITSVTLTSNQFSRNGYTFSKWTTNTDGTGITYTNGQTITDIPVSSVIHLYAQWTANGVSLSFDAGIGTVNPTSKTVTYDSTYGTLPVPTPPAGYTWDKDDDGNGWFMSDTGVGINTSTIVSRTDAHTLVAKYTANSYTITFDWNWNYEREAVNKVPDLSSTTKNVTYDSLYGALPNPKRDGYTFLGWFLSESGDNGTGTQITALTKVTTVGNHTLYAKWQNNEYTLNFDYNLDYRVDPN